MRPAARETLQAGNNGNAFPGCVASQLRQTWRVQPVDSLATDNLRVTLTGMGRKQSDLQVGRGTLTAQSLQDKGGTFKVRILSSDACAQGASPVLLKGRLLGVSERPVVVAL